MSPAVKIAAVKASGSIDTAFANPINVALGANPGGATRFLQTLTPTGGVATFGALAVDHPGNGYTLITSSRRSPQFPSAHFDVAATG